MTTLVRENVLSLSVPERIQLVEDIWAHHLYNPPEEIMMI